MPSNSDKVLPQIENAKKYGDEIYSTLSAGRKQTIETISQVSDYKDWNIYEMTISYDYDLEEVNKAWNTLPDTTELMQHYINIAIPGADIPYQAPNYGCSALTCCENEDDAKARIDNSDENSDLQPQVFMGRNYDFQFDSSAMLVRCNPKNGYRSISFSGLDHIFDNNPLLNNLTKEMALTCPFVTLDGVNEKGLCATVLTLDSEPTIHNNGRGLLMPGTLIRLCLDRASSTKEAIEMLKNYDIFSISGRDYHYYITDATGDGRIIEYDPHTPGRDMVVTPTRSITNFYKIYEDKVKPNQHNGIYGHGRERDLAMSAVFDKYDGHGGRDLAFEALKAASQKPNPAEVTSNTQWSAVYNMTNPSVEISLHRRWDDVFKFTI